MLRGAGGRRTARGRWCALGVAVVHGVASAACGYDLPTRPDYAFIRVGINTSGGDLDVDGYHVIVDNSTFKVVSDSAVESFYVPSGEHTVSIANVDANCAVTGPASRTVTANVAETVSVTFEVVCVATGIAVTTRTTGSDWPANLRLVVDGLSPVLIPASGTQTIGRLTPGTHLLTLQPPTNCTVAGGNAISVVVAASEVTNVTLAVSCTPVVRPPRIAYSIDTLANGIAERWIELVNVDGTEPTSLHAGDAPAWSPDGKQLAFSDAVCPGGFYYYYCSGGVIVGDPEVGDVTALLRGENGTHPSWSPTGDRVVFHDIAAAPEPVLDVLGTRDHVLTRLIFTGPTWTLQPAWSPDGTRIAFVCQWPAPADICVTNADGTGLAHLTTDEQVDQEPAWSPDGTKIAFARYPAGTTDPANATDASVALMDLGTRQLTVLGPGADPAWSPDGSKLVIEGTDGLFVMNADGSGRTRLTTGPHHAPAWRP